MTPIRIGYIDYLNSLPIYLGLERGDARSASEGADAQRASGVPTPPGAGLVKAAPTTLNAMLSRGELDVSPVSSIHYAKHCDDLVLLPDLSINSAGFVHSVGLFYRNGIESLHGGTVSVTSESATSDVLLRILLERRFALDAKRVTGDADLEGVLDGRYQGALAYPALGRVDLGEEWTRWTGTPMVFAVWCARKSFARAHPEALRAAHEWLLAGKAWGRSHRADVVEVARKRVFLSRAFMERYFRDLNYDLDAPKLAGLLRYYELAAELGEIERVPPLTLEARA